MMHKELEKKFKKIIKADDESQLIFKETLAEIRRRTRKTAIILSVSVIISLAFMLTAASKNRSSTEKIEDLQSQVSELQIKNCD